MSDLADKIAAVHRALEAAALPHAFGGALALAWCTEQARGTIDIDLNVFVNADQSDALFRALPAEVSRTAAELTVIRRDGQVRLWWERTPLDLFLNTTQFHDEAATRIRWEKFAGVSLPFLSCNDIATFKAFFNRTKDRADIEAMHAAGTLNVAQVIDVLAQYLGSDDERIVYLQRIAVTGSSR